MLCEMGVFMTILEKIDYQFHYVENFDPKDERVLFNGLNEEATLRKAMTKPMKPYGIFIKDSDNQVLGGVKGITYYGCVYVSMLWLTKELRQEGLGTKLMREVERIGIERECTFVTVNTMDWEALNFYQKIGFHIEFVREGYENESKLYFMRKKLNA